MIDSHHHLWNYTDAEFSWLDASLKQSFLAGDLEQTLTGTGISGTIAVQARCSLEENDFLIEQANNTELIKGIVGWVDLTAGNAGEILSELSQNPLIKGVREITQGASDEQFFANSDFNQGIDLLGSNNLTYDVLIFANQLEAADSFVKKHPNIPMVLDHCGKPTIKQTTFPTQWAEGIKKIAQNENLMCKLSGLPTEILDGSPCTAELLQPYFDTILEAFGPQRIMLGSDWPVSLSVTAYNDWMATVKTLCSSLSCDEQQAILGLNANRFYQL